LGRYEGTVYQGHTDVIAKSVKSDFFKNATVLKNHRQTSRQCLLWGVLYFLSGICIRSSKDCATLLLGSDFFISSHTVRIQRWTLDGATAWPLTGR
jgi:hypothetical protein